MRDRRRGALALTLAFAGLAGGPADARAAPEGVVTRSGIVAVRAIDAGEAERSAILLDGRPIAEVNGDASLFKLAIRHAADFVLVDAWKPGLHCHHGFTLLKISGADEPVLSAPFGECMTLFGARMLDGDPVVQLQDAVADDSGNARTVHEFVLKGDRIQPLPAPLTRCEASALAAASMATPTDSRRSRGLVGGTGRSHVYLAPVDECRTATFLVPGDVVEVGQAHAAYAAIVYRHPRTGRVTRGWVKRDRLVDAPAVPGIDPPLRTGTSAAAPPPAMPTRSSGSPGPRR